MPEEKQAHKETSDPEVVDFAVLDLKFHQGPDLTVNQTVKLGNQDHLVPELAMLGKEPVPSLSLAVIPGAAVKHQLAFI